MNKTIFKICVVAAITLVANSSAYAQFGKLIDKANKTINEQRSGNTGSYTNTEAVAALKEALKIGTQNASGRLNTLNGFFGNQLIKVLMPPEAKKVETAMRAAGFGQQVDKAILSMNRAAEDAAGKAVPIFVDAISGMSVQDGISIVRGGQGAATNYLKNRTTQSLTSAFRPVIKTSLDKVDATKYWADVFTIYNKLPLTSKVNTDLVAYVTERALNGLFVTITDEENKIRNNASSRVTDLLRKVFGKP